MERKLNFHTEEEKEQREAVIQESKITGLDLAMQIFPLLEDYFCDAFAKNSKGVLMNLKNGQLFRLTVTEVG